MEMDQKLKKKISTTSAVLQMIGAIGSLLVLLILLAMAISTFFFNYQIALHTGVSYEGSIFVQELGKSGGHDMLSDFVNWFQKNSPLNLLDTAIFAGWFWLFVSPIFIVLLQLTYMFSGFRKMEFFTKKNIRHIRIIAWSLVFVALVEFIMFGWMLNFGQQTDVFYSQLIDFMYEQALMFGPVICGAFLSAWLMQMAHAMYVDRELTI